MRSRGNSTTTSFVEIATRMQLYGVLSKRPFGHPSNKWNRRFFVIRDGYLLYYPESEKKEFEKKQYFNIHPKGCLPLGGCHIESVQETGHPFTIHITSEEMNGRIIVAAESEYEQDKWMKCLRESARITWNNAQISEAVIQQQEQHGLQMAREKQDYYDQLLNESTALHDERLKTEELERIREEMEKEHKKMEQHALAIQDQYQTAKSELDQMAQSMAAIEQDKRHIGLASAELHKNLEILEQEKQKTLQKLQEESSKAEKLTEEKNEMSQLTSSLQSTLKQIEDKTRSLLEEKKKAEDRMHENEAKALQLEEEKQVISEHAQELQESMKELAAQNATTEAELKVEVVARLEAERRLKEAESSLHRLEKDVMNAESDGRDADEIREEMIGDVKTLKKFFENLAFEAKLDADKPLMIKNSIHARKTMVRRAKTMKYEMTRKKRSRASMDSSDLCATSPDLSLAVSMAMGGFCMPSSPLDEEEDVDELSSSATASARNHALMFRHSSIDVTDHTRDIIHDHFSAEI